jgi:hypothetical protein
MRRDTLTIDRRFNGPPDSGNGGYVCGRLASYVSRSDPVVTLRRPPPLAIALDVTASPDGARLADGKLLIAEAAGTELDVAPIEPAPFEAALAAERSYPGLAAHPFPTCFTCRPQRRPGAGPRLFPGRLADGRVLGLAYATWIALPGG